LPESGSVQAVLCQRSNVKGVILSMSSSHVGAITFDWYPFDPLVRRLAETAVDAGYKVDVICLRRIGEKRYEECNGVHVYRMPMGRSFGRSLPMTILEWCWFLFLSGIFVTRLHMKHAYEVIHVHNMPDFLVFSALTPKLLGAKIILEVQDVSPELMGVKARGRLRDLVTRLATWQERISTSFAHHVITVGWPFEELLLQRGVPREKLTVILNSVYTKLYPPSRRTHQLSKDANEARPFILMYHGTLAERNGLDIAIRALAIALRSVPELRLDIQGRGEQLPNLKKLATELGVADRVMFSDPCPSEEVVDFVVHGDIGIIPYNCDPFMDLVLPTKAYEYAWMHRPIIASNTRAIRSMFRPESIALCEPSNPESFAQAIIDLYRRPEKRAAMVVNAAQDYIPYQWELMAERYQNLLASFSGKQDQEVNRRDIVSTRM
jgi:glycosyltransferase involved in cell wall biosynthesis